MRALPEILVIRHGQTEWNAQGRWQGVLDSPLTEAGVAQARAMGAVLRAHGIGRAEFDLLHSPQGRAQRTAQIIAEAAGLDLTPEPRLREIDVGAWAGLSREELERGWPAADPHEHFLDRYARAPGGEPFADLWVRVADLLAALRRPTVLVTHGITSRFLRTCAMGMDESALAELPGGQGIIYRVRNGQHDVLEPPDLAKPLPVG